MTVVMEAREVWRSTGWSMDLARYRRQNMAPADTGWKGVLLIRDHEKNQHRISNVTCRGTPPVPLPKFLEVDGFLKLSLSEQQNLPHFELAKLNFSYHPESEWSKFLAHLCITKKVADVKYDGWQLLLQQPTEGAPDGFESIRVLYRPNPYLPPVVPAKRDRPEELQLSKDSSAAASRHSGQTHSHVTVELNEPSSNGTSSDVRHEHLMSKLSTSMDLRPPSHTTNQYDAQRKRPCATGKFTGYIFDEAIDAPFENPELKSPSMLIGKPLQQKCSQTTTKLNGFISNEGKLKSGESIQKIRSNNLRRAQFQWMLGTTLQFMYLAADRYSTRVDVNIEEFYWSFPHNGRNKVWTLRNVKTVIIADNGKGMSREEVLDLFHIKEMGAWADILVLTQTHEAQYIGLLSRECRNVKTEFLFTKWESGHRDIVIEPDAHLQSEEDIPVTMIDTIERFSPFDRVRVKSEFKKIGESNTGTRIFIYLSEEAQKMEVPDVKTEKVRFRINGLDNNANCTEISKKNLEEQLHIYAKALFLTPQIMIYAQNIKVNESLGEELARVGNQLYGTVDGKEIFLSLSFNEIDHRSGRGGIFVYNGNRLVAAYLKVGKMIGNLDYGRGVVGVVDITNLMDVGDELLSYTKTEFFIEEFKQHKTLMRWLADMVHEYIGNLENVENISVKECFPISPKKESNEKLSKDVVNGQTCHIVPGTQHQKDLCAIVDNGTFSDFDQCDPPPKPVHRGVVVGKGVPSDFDLMASSPKHVHNSDSEEIDMQCGKCLIWRKVPSSCDIDNLPLDWDCSMWPYHGVCDILGEEIAINTLDDATIAVSKESLGYMPCQDESDEDQVEEISTSTSIPKEPIDFTPCQVENGADQVEETLTGSDNEVPSDEWEVEAILDSQFFLDSDELHYLVHWTGYHISESSWEPASHLRNSPELLQQFHTKYPSKPNVNQRFLLN